MHHPAPTRRPLTAAASLLLVGAVAATLTTTAPHASAAPRDLVANGGFEGGTSGWFASSGSTLSTTGAHHSGSASAHVGNPRSGAATVALNDRTNTVVSTTKGATYTASAWVKASRAGTSAGVRLMEYAGSSLEGQRKGTVWLTDTKWHQVKTTYTAAADGATVDLNVLAWSLAGGGSLDVDDVSLTATGAADAPPAPAPTPTPTPTPTSSPSPSGWHRVWDDEFDGSSVDGSKWNVRNNDHNGYERSCLTNRSKNVSVSGGSLHIVGQRENMKCGGYNGSFTSGYLDTIGKFSTAYGRYEMRAKMPTQAGSSKGLWPAFWLRPDDGGLGELDIMEAVGSDPGEKNYDHVSQTLWYKTDGSVKGQSKAAYPKGGTMSDGYHTYAVEWEKGAIRWYVDGELTYSRDRSTTSWLSAAFDGGRKFHIRLNLQIGGAWPGLPTGHTKFPADYAVDYVRVYQR
ncbi:beta-glucanase (GH16 family) [Motilibacter peucedani]|uniref:Beta-glucanase (GH16 family) n=1 Tax=Motilibacter peucedani TaxID=598650 RepID=A0A420XNB8_9ACTN|nr:family 16 glycosylhydrolase [Motilibacter peucedani]RKS72749.1 beta-glucanase (GH16 family) [Motilibacter peucedani]